MIAWIQRLRRRDCVGRFGQSFEERPPSGDAFNLQGDAELRERFHWLLWMEIVPGRAVTYVDVRSPS